MALPCSDKLRAAPRRFNRENRSPHLHPPVFFLTVIPGVKGTHRARITYNIQEDDP